jgi:hypothetical protein
MTHHGPFSRPNFFAGQLLTEDDLDAVVEYMVAKDRLHNRYLHGDGVVCGLWVSCAPCEPAQIVVSGGYALDCCGSDIVVDCDVTLDVNDLIAALPRHACLDPCEPPEQDGIAASKRRYTLVAVAREEAADPIAPYPSGDDCGPVDVIDCQPSRIVEYATFELRCDVPPRGPTSVVDRFLACIGVLDPSDRLRGAVESALAAIVDPSDTNRPSTRFVGEILKRAGIEVTLDWLECRLQGSDVPPCGLIERVRCLRRSQPDVRGVDADEELWELASEYVLECLCRAINPPCPPCPDVAVVLATIDVEACKVTRICNAARHYVITPATLSYWLPALERVYDNVRSLCCEPCREDARRGGPYREMTDVPLEPGEALSEVSAATAAPVAKKAARPRAAKAPRRKGT